MSRRRFTKEFDVKRAKLSEWASQLERFGDDAFSGPGRRPASQPRGGGSANSFDPRRGKAS